MAIPAAVTPLIEQMVMKKAMEEGTKALGEGGKGGEKMGGGAMGGSMGAPTPPKPEDLMKSFADGSMRMKAAGKAVKKGMRKGKRKIRRGALRALLPF